MCSPDFAAVDSIVVALLLALLQGLPVDSLYCSLMDSATVLSCLRVGAWGQAQLGCPWLYTVVADVLGVKGWAERGRTLGVRLDVVMEQLLVCVGIDVWVVVLDQLHVRKLPWAT